MYPFGNFELILGVLSLLSIDWFGRDGLRCAFQSKGFAAGLRILCIGFARRLVGNLVFIVLYTHSSRSD